MFIYLNSTLKKILTDKGISEYVPAYGGESAGLDLYCAGEVKFLRSPTATSASMLIPTGLHINLPKNMVGLILDRGSISKTAFVRRAGVIDPGYKGEIFVNLVNLDLSTIKLGDKLPVQLVVVPFISDYKEVTLEEYNTMTSTSKRGDGALGSSNQ